MYGLVPDTHPALRARAERIPIDDIGSEHIQTLISDMKKVLASQALGVAIAAPQVGEPIQLFVVSKKALKKDSENEQEDSVPETDDLVFINPELVKISRTKKEMHEGCLSMPGLWGMVPRAEKATIKAYNEQGVQFTRGASGLLAHIFQHEMDHLEGVLYIDKANRIMQDGDKDESADR